VTGRVKKKKGQSNDGVFERGVIGSYEKGLSQRLLFCQKGERNLVSATNKKRMEVWKIDYGSREGKEKGARRLVKAYHQSKKKSIFGTSSKGRKGRRKSHNENRVKV